MSNLMKTLTIGDASYEICDASARETLKNTVKSINGATPDENGNIEVKVTSGSSGADWNQNDPEAPDYVKNRTHYDAGRPVELPIFSGESLAFTESPNEDETGIMYIYEMQESDVFTLIAGNTYYVTIDGETHETKAMSMGESVYIGNFSIVVSVYPNTGEPFFVMPNAGLFALSIAGETHNVTISEIKNVVEKEIIPYNEYTFSVMNPDMIPMLINIGSFDLSNMSEGDSYNVTFDGVEYKNTVKTMYGSLVFGNLNLISSDEEYTGEPYLALYAEGMSGMYAVTTSIQAKFSIDKVLADGTYETVVPEGTRELVGDNGYQWIDTEFGCVLEENTTYKIVWNDIEYTCTSVGQNMGSEEEPMMIVYMGNLSKIGMSDTDTGEPFIFGYMPGEGFVAMMMPDASFTDTHQIKVTGYVSGVKKLDKKYLPDDIDIPVASYNKIGGVKVRDALSGLGSGSAYTPIYLDTDDNQIYAKAQSSMSSLTFTGNTNATYNGSSPVTVNIPTALKNPNRLTFTGGSTATYDGSSAVSVTIPTALKNPYALTFSGAVSGSYDGSTSKSVYIPPAPTSLKNPNALTFTGLIEGAYDGSEAINIEIPTGLPEVTVDNNGQILQIVDGAWVNNNPVFNYTVYIDQSDGIKYYVYIYNGELVISDGYLGIEVTKIPDKTAYLIDKETEFNPDGMVVCMKHIENGYEEIVDYTYTSENTSEAIVVTITCTYNEKTYQTSMSLPFVDADTMFADFDYTENNDGTYTLDAWKGTLNGVESTECVIPTQVYDLIIV